MAGEGDNMSDRADNVQNSTVLTYAGPPDPRQLMRIRLLSGAVEFTQGNETNATKCKLMQGAA